MTTARESPEQAVELTSLDDHALAHAVERRRVARGLDLRRPLAIDGPDARATSLAVRGWLANLELSASEPTISEIDRAYANLHRRYAPAAGSAADKQRARAGATLLRALQLAHQQLAVLWLRQAPAG